MGYFLVQIRYYINALRDYPKGWRCGGCGRPNFYFDDAGFFIERDKPVCRHCHNPLLTGDR